MKLICSILAIFVVISVAISSDRIAKEKAIMDGISTCQKEKGLTKAPNTTYCVMACVMVKLGVMNDANKLVPNKINFIVDEDVKSKDGKTVKQISREVDGECKSVSDLNKCDAAYKIAVCVAEGIVKRGFGTNVFL